VEILGELERTFATTIYPNRVLFAVAGVVLFALLVVLARRRRWDLAARRRPRRTAAGVLIALAVFGPLGWYLGSPLVLSSTIDEPTPIVAVPSASAAAAIAPGERSGAFIGADEFHFGRGTARILETAPGSFTVRLEDFAVRNGPDLYVYLSPSPEGSAQDAIDIGRLKADRGNQNYAVPPGTDLANVRSVVIWCKEFGVLFATASLG